ncbi:hypothetical protein SUGI_1009100 [Cryptomeria japonica]|nr:hypothetical protein SUGI_1009100 [Cryptomeria japonica]
MDFQEWRWIKIVLFCVAVVAVKACIWRSKGVYDQFHGAPPKFSALFVFGDSLADCGNNNYINTSVAARANFAPYGKTFFGTPTGRFSDGRTIFDFLASRMGMHFPAPWFQSRVGLVSSEGANFASAGSGLLDSTFQHLNVISFGRQVKEFRDAFYMVGGVSGYPAQQMLSDSVIAINIGANDIAGNYLTNSSFNHKVRPQAFIQSLLEIYKHYLLELHEIGGRKFVVFGIGPLGCSPGMRYAGLAKWKGGCDETANEMFQEFNLGLQKLIRHLNRNLIGSTFLYVNTYDLVLGIINNGKTLGFSEIESACCGEGTFNAGVGCGQKSEHSVCEDASRHIFWDSFHPTEAVQKIIAEEVWGGNSSVFPSNLRNVIHAPASPYIHSFTA